VEWELIVESGKVDPSLKACFHHLSVSYWNGSDPAALGAILNALACALVTFGLALLLYMKTSDC
jgi:hypothetical protein